MIIAFLMITFNLMALLILGLLTTISFILPDSLTNTISWGADYIGYAKGDLPLTADPTMTGPASYIGILDMLYFLYTYFVVLLTIKLIMRIVGIIPFIGSSARALINYRKASNV